MDNPSDIDRIEDLLRSVIPDLLKQLGWPEASEMMRRVPSLRHDLQRLSRMPRILEQMRGKVEHAQNRVKRFEKLSAADPKMSARFTHLHKELGVFVAVLTSTGRLIEGYLAQKSSTTDSEFCPVRLTSQRP
jgi:hypothetical protein